MFRFLYSGRHLFPSDINLCVTIICGSQRNIYQFYITCRVTIPFRILSKEDLEKNAFYEKMGKCYGWWDPKNGYKVQKSCLVHRISLSKHLFGSRITKYSANKVNQWTNPHETVEKRMLKIVRCPLLTKILKKDHQNDHRINFYHLDTVNKVLS